MHDDALVAHRAAGHRPPDARRHRRHHRQPRLPAAALGRPHQRGGHLQPHCTSTWMGSVKYILLFMTRINTSKYLSVNKYK